MLYIYIEWQPDDRKTGWIYIPVFIHIMIVKLLQFYERFNWLVDYMNIVLYTCVNNNKAKYYCWACLFINKKGPDAYVRLAEARESNIIPLVKPSLMYIFFHGSFIHYWKRFLKDMKKNQITIRWSDLAYYPINVWYFWLYGICH